MRVSTDVGSHQSTAPGLEENACASNKSRPGEVDSGSGFSLDEEQQSAGQVRAERAALLHPAVKCPLLQNALENEATL